VTPPPPPSARDTEATETPASRATSLIVTVAMRVAPSAELHCGDNVIVFMKPCKASANKASAALRKVYANVFMSGPDKWLAERKMRDWIGRIALWQCSMPRMRRVPGWSVMRGICGRRLNSGRFCLLLKISSCR
jgi:hypothetical protein